MDHEIEKLNGDNLVKVVFQLQESDLHDHATESLWAAALAVNRGRLKNIPFYVYGVSYNDVVNMERHDDLYIFQSVAKRGGHSTYRIFLREGASELQFEYFWGPLKDVGCTYERGTDYLLAVDVPPESDIYKAYRALERGEEADVWDFEEGFCGHPLTE